MKLVALDIPEDRRELIEWLEHHLTGESLRELAIQLQAVRGQNISGGSEKNKEDTPVDIQQLLHPHFDSVMHDGLSSAPESTLNQLLTRPDLLLDLQEQVLLFGGEYWRRLFRGNDRSKSSSVDVSKAEEISKLDAPILDAHGNVTPFMPSQSGNAEANPMPNDRTDVASSRRLPVSPSIKSKKGAKSKSRSPESGFGFFKPVLFLSAMAASLLLGMFVTQELNQRQSTGPVAWGWQAESALAENRAADIYLRGLAISANQWFDKPVSSSAEVAQRLGELRMGCSRLILASHTPLAPEDRAWLIEKCQKWAGALDQLLVRLEAGGDPSTIKLEADQVVTKLVKAIQDRADIAVLAFGPNVHGMASEIS